MKQGKIKMRILIDTNILISALFFGKFPKEFLNEVLKSNFEVCINEQILSEYEKTIAKKIARRKNILDEELFEKFFVAVKIFEISSDLKVCRDPDDDKFINCAIDAKAIYIVSGDNDLLTLKNFAGIEIVTAREFYDKYIKPSAM